MPCRACTSVRTRVRQAIWPRRVGVAQARLTGAAVLGRTAAEWAVAALAGVAAWAGAEAAREPGASATEARTVRPARLMRRTRVGGDILLPFMAGGPATARRGSE